MVSLRAPTTSDLDPSDYSDQPIVTFKQMLAFIEKLNLPIVILLDV